jgi:hypothetical protein
MKEPRNENTIIQIKLAFEGARRNLCLLETALLNIINIHLGQYSNYLSQVALCIELGLKSIIINTYDLEYIHDIEKLFSMTPNVFQEKFKTLYPDDKIFIQNMSNTKKMFEKFRYMELNSNLKEYLDANIINEDRTVNFQKVVELSNFQFLGILLDEIVEYEKFIRKETVKQIAETDCVDINSIIEHGIKALKCTQSNIVLMIK